MKSTPATSLVATIGNPKLPDQYVRNIFFVKGAAILVIVAGSLVTTRMSGSTASWALYTFSLGASLIPTLLVLMRGGHVGDDLLRTSFLLDVLAITVGVHLGGGIDNVSMPLLFMASIALAGLLLTPLDACLIGGCAVIGYDAIVLAEYLGWLPHMVSYFRPPVSQLATAAPVNLYLLLFSGLVAIAVGHFRALYRAVEQRRREAAYSLSHDLKNPLSVILGYVELMADASPEDQRVFASGVERAAQEGLDLVSNVLDAATFEGRPVTPRAVRCDVNELVRDVAERYRGTAQVRNVEIELHLDPGAPPADIDQQLVARALANLVTNAIKYGARGGVVAIATAAHDDDISIEVRDRGPGLSAVQQSELFQPYSRVASSRGIEGTGLGLYLVRRIAEAHDGSVSVRSAEGEGATFTLTLPLRQPI